MIPVLFKKNEKQFRTYGLGEITDIIRPEVTRERNGQYQLYFQYPNNAEFSSVFEKEMKIKSDAGVRTKWQTFIISRVIREEGKLIEIFANHISQNLVKDALNPKVNASGSAQSALQTWNNNRVGGESFDVWSDITTSNRTDWTIDNVSNAFEALAGVQGSILDIWGGEYEFDNNMIRLHKSMGRKMPVHLEYGRNIKSITQDQQEDNEYTSIYPYATYIPENKEDVEIVTIPELFVDGKYIEMYEQRKIQVVDFSAEFDSNNPPTASKLKTLANQYVNVNEVGLPHENLKVEYIDLAKTLDYKDFATMEEVELNDTLPIFYPKFDVTNNNAKAVVIEYDPVKEENISIELGVIGQSFRSVSTGGINGRLDRVEKQQKNNKEFIINSKGNRIWYTEPYEDMEHKIGDTWFEENGPYTRIHVWNGSQWITKIDTEDIDEAKKIADEALEEAEEAKQEAEEAKDRAEQAVTEAISEAESIVEAKDVEYQQKFDDAQAEINQVSNKANEAVSRIDGEIAGKFTLIDVELGNIENLANTAKDDAAEALADARLALEYTDDDYIAIKALETNFDELAGKVELRATKQEVNALEGTVVTQGTQIGLNTSKISAKAEKSYVDTVKGTVEDNTAELAIQADEISKRLKTTTFDTQMGTINSKINQTIDTVDSHTSTIATLRTDVDGKATISQFNTLESTVDGTVRRIGDAEGNITQIEASVNSLQTTVGNKADKSQVTQLSTLVNTKVSSNDVETILANDKRIKDTRDDNRNPSWYFDNYPGETVREFKRMTTIGALGTGTYGVLVTEVPWFSSSGGKIKQIFYGDSVTSERRGTGSSWEPWKEIPDKAYLDSQISVLSSAINLRVQKGDVLSQINLEADRALIQTGKLYLDADTVNFSGKAFIPSANIIELTANKITGTTAQFTTLRSKVITANTITANHIQSDNALIDKIFATQAQIDRLVSKQIFTNALTSRKIITDGMIAANAQIDGAKLKDATIGSAKIAYLDAGKITTGTLQGITIIAEEGYIANFEIVGNVLSSLTPYGYTTVKGGGDVAFATSSPEAHSTTNATLQIWHNGRLRLDYGGQIDFQAVSSATTVGTIRVNANDNLSIDSFRHINFRMGGQAFFEGHVAPYADNTYSVGNTTYYWRNIYLQYNPTVRSDIRYKKDVQGIPTELIEALKEVEPKMYEMGGAWHFGYIAQDVERALYKYSLKEVGYKKAKKHMKKLKLLAQDDHRMSLVYAEIAVLKAEEQNRQIKELETTIKQQEKRIEELENAS